MNHSFGSGTGRWGRRIIAWFCAFGLVFVTARCPAQETCQITFDGQPPGTGVLVQQYFEGGMWFRPIGPTDPGNTFTRHGGGIATSPENGTAYLRAGLGQSLTFGFLDGSTFNLVSVDLAEYSTLFQTPLTVPFVGYRSDGSVLNTSFTTDGIIDGTGPIADFQTFHFGLEWSDLMRVEIPARGWSLDNLVVAVPEPGIWALLLLAGAFGGFWYFKRRSGMKCR